MACWVKSSFFKKINELFIYQCFYFLQHVAVLKTLQLHPPAVDYYISIFVTTNLLFLKISIPPSPPPPCQREFFFIWTPLPSGSSRLSSDFPLNKFPCPYFLETQFYLHCFLKLGVVKLYSKNMGLAKLFNYWI